MKQISKTLIAALVGCVILVPAASAQQAQPGTDKPGTDKPGAEVRQRSVIELPFPIAVLDVQTILRNAASVKNIRDQINSYGTKFEEEIQKERDQIRKANQELARQRTILAPDVFAEKRRQFEQQVVEVQRLVQQRQRELDTVRNEAMEAVNKAYIEIVSNLAGDRNLFMILQKGQTVFAAPQLDVTKEVLSRLDKQLPSVKVMKPGTAKADKTASEKAKPGK